MKTEDNTNLDDSLNSLPEQSKGLSKFLSRTAKKVGFTVYDLATDGLFQIAQEASRTSESEKDCNSANDFINRMSTQIREYEGFYTTEDKNMTIQVEKCTAAKMDFIIASKIYSKSIKCTGKFLGHSKVLYSGQHCTLTLTLYSDEDFIMKGKLPWEDDDIELHFMSPKQLKKVLKKKRKN